MLKSQWSSGAQLIHEGAAVVVVVVGATEEAEVAVEEVAVDLVVVQTATKVVIILP